MALDTGKTGDRPCVYSNLINIIIEPEKTTLLVITIMITSKIYLKKKQKQKVIIYYQLDLFPPHMFQMQPSEHSRIFTMD